jgi:hypothetical protein
VSLFLLQIKITARNALVRLRCEIHTTALKKALFGLKEDRTKSAGFEIL